MTVDSSGFDWLPDHQLHVVSTLAHVDELIWRAGDVLYAYLEPGPLDLVGVINGSQSELSVRSVAPLPAAVSLYVADALTHLRAAIEHSIFAEVEQRLGRPLDAGEAKRISMPIYDEETNLRRWLAQNRRTELAPLREGSTLIERIRPLQPYQRPEPLAHPLRLLAEYSNFAKHRGPAIAATHLGAVVPVGYIPELAIAQDFERQIRVGDILATGPSDQQVAMDIWPKIAIQRPHTGTWHVLMTELGQMEDWVRRVAVPTLITGTEQILEIPPQLETAVGHTDLRIAMTHAGKIPAARRNEHRIQAAMVRARLAEILPRQFEETDPTTIKLWLAQLNDESMLRRFDGITRFSLAGDAPGLVSELSQLMTDIEEWGRQSS